MYWSEKARLRTTIRDLETRLAVANKFVERVHGRNSELLMALFEVRRQLRDANRAGRPRRPHVSCVDAWADGRDPCVDCEPLLPTADGSRA